MTKTENNGHPILLFASAFSLGAMFAYFSTPCGKKKRQEIAKKWDEVKAYLYKEGLIKDKNMSFEDFRQDYLSKLGDSFKEMKDAFEGRSIEKELAHLAKLKRRRSRKNKPKFKGI